MHDSPGKDVQNQIIYTSKQLFGWLKINYDILLLITLGVVGSLLLWVSTPWGIGVGYDSVFYLSAAENFLDGLGLSRIDGYQNVVYLTHYPPLYTLILAAARYLTASESIAVMARALSALSFGFLIILIGITVRTFTGSKAAAVLSALFALSSPFLLDVHLMAMSEPLFLLFLILMLLTLSQYLNGRKFAWLVISGAIGALVYLTRYVGLTAITTGVIAILIFGPGKIGRRIKDALVFSFMGIFPILIWYARNYILTGTTTNRSFAFHPPTSERLLSGLTTIYAWMIPGGIPPGIRPIVMVGIVIGGLFLLVFGGYHFWKRRHNDAVIAAAWKFFIISVLFIFIYISSILLSLTFFDASTKLNNRILSPVYFIGIMMLFLLLWNGLDLNHSRTGTIIIVLLILGAISNNIVKSSELLTEMRLKGLGFTGRRWQSSETIEGVKELPIEGVLYSNEAFPIYFITGRPASWIPEKGDSVLGQENNAYDQKIEMMKAAIEETGGALVIFDSRMNPSVYGSEDELTLGLVLWKDTSDGAIYVSP
jgi:4-amino-4-deoxy-L-arabinose transferase-like glycosyltransferase